MTVEAPLKEIAITGFRSGRQLDPRLKPIAILEQALARLWGKRPPADRAIDLSWGICDPDPQRTFDLIVAPHATEEELRLLAPRARDGVLSLCMTSLFEDVVACAESIPFSVERITTSGQTRLLEGRIAPKAIFSRTFSHLMAEAEWEIAAIGRTYSVTGQLPPGVPAEPVEPRAPRPGALARYALDTSCLAARRGLERLRGQAQRWSVGIVPSGWESADLAKATIVANPPHRYFADPFLVRREGRDVCFVEDFDFRSSRASISALERQAAGNWKRIGDALVEPFHLSFPFTFECEGELYMVPESHESGQIRLYICDAFPLGWRHVRNLMEGVSAVDTMIFDNQGRWFMLTNISPTGSDEHQSRLFLFSSADPRSVDWRPATGNPLLFDSRKARNGGLLHGGDGSLYRVRQKQGCGRYGSGLSIARIEGIGPDDYREEMVRELNPDFLPGLIGCHHLHSNGAFTAFDMLRIESRA